jgi:hypothetical protein
LVKVPHCNPSSLEPCSKGAHAITWQWYLITQSDCHISVTSCNTCVFVHLSCCCIAHRLPSGILCCHCLCYHCFVLQAVKLVMCSYRREQASRQAMHLCNAFVPCILGPTSCCALLLFACDKQVFQASCFPRQCLHPEHLHHRRVR